MWRFDCDFGHSWRVVEVVEGVEPDPGPCAEDGTLPVTARREPSADRLSFRLVPVARVTDSFRGTVVGDGIYYLELFDREGSRFGRSRNAMPLPELCAHIREFSEVAKVDALRKARRMGYDILN